jgi:4-amino-4-deoxy-L-arabinose transferase-like glycosyltransferase
MPSYLAMGHFFSMNAFDVFFWALLALIAVRALAGDQAKTWLVFGLVAGIGLMNKISVGLLGLGLALVLRSARSLFLRPHLWLGALIALLIFLPQLVWQLEFDWPILEFQANARAAKNVVQSPLGFAGEQVLLADPISLPARHWDCTPGDGET